MNWKTKNVLVTGGASFIGSHLVDRLVELGGSVRVVDDLSSGLLDNINHHVESERISFIQADLRETDVSRQAVKDIDVVFHLAADHGGRGYIETHQSACAGNLALDGIVFRASKEVKVEKIVFASSACVYPGYLQADPTKEVYLSEDSVKPPYDADNLYGWAKLMGELTLQAYAAELGIKTASCRYFTVYGERCTENHAIMAMIARAFIKQDPFVVWGNGEQVRNWTYVGDIVKGTILVAEKIDDGTAVNIGTNERTRVIDAVREVLKYTGHKAEIELHPEMPTGPLNRAADITLVNNLIGWKPQVVFEEGLHKTIDWYYTTKDPDRVKASLENKLSERVNVVIQPKKLA